MSDQNAPENRNTTTVTEELELMGNQVLDRVKGLIEEGNVRRIIIRTSDGKTLVDTTLTVGALAGGVLALVAGPFLTAVAAIAAAVVGRVQIEVVREVVDTDIELGDSKTRVQITSEDNGTL
jgi:hypothetical protein